MAKQIIWSPMAINDLAVILKYLTNTWNSKVASDFLVQIDRIIEFISVNQPLFHSIYRNNNIRKIVLTKQNTLFYRVKKRQIIILRIFDTRQDPNKLILS